MYRREFIVNSGLVLGAVVVGLPSFADAIEPDPAIIDGGLRPRLVGIKRLGCARALDDPAIALQWPAEFPTHFA